MNKRVRLILGDDNYYIKIEEPNGILGSNSIFYTYDETDDTRSIETTCDEKDIEKTSKRLINKYKKELLDEIKENKRKLKMLKVIMNKRMK